MRTIVAFLSRPHGYDVLNGLVKSQDYRILKLYTHALNPLSQDPSRSERSDYSLFVELCKQNKIELVPIDSQKEPIQSCPDCDYIIEVSWRYLIPENITSKAKIAAFGIHRGKLPDYARAEPIKQALLKNEKEIILSVHYLDFPIDQGKVISTISHPVNYDESIDFDSNIQRLRNEITPLFSKLAFQTIKLLESSKKI